MNSPHRHSVSRALLFLGLPIALLLPLRAQDATTTPSPAPMNPASGNPGLLQPPGEVSSSTSNPAPTVSKGALNGSAPAANAPAPAIGSSAAPARPLTHADLVRLQNQEIIRRQELLLRANQALAEARKAELANDYPVARQNYLFATEAFDTISRATASYAISAEGLTRADLAIYNDALQRADTIRAKQMLDEIVKYNPNNPRVNAKVAKMNRALADPNSTSLFGNTAVTPGFVKQLATVQQLFDEAEQFRRTGQYDEAESRLKKILGIDPYNITATRQLDRITAEKLKYAEDARLETRAERLRQVEEKWYEPITNREASTSAQEAQPTLTLATSHNIEDKLRNIQVSTNFRDATIEDATAYLNEESQKLDPDHKGVSFIIDPDAQSSAAKITLALSDVPLVDALNYVCRLANVKYKVQEYAVSIIPLSANSFDLISRVFIVSPSFVTIPTSLISDAAPAADNAAGARFIPTPGGTPATPTDLAGDSAQAALEAKGVKFAPGGSAVYSAATGQLTVVDTADNMEFVEELVGAGQAPVLMVRIATKFVEINQTDLNDVTFNYGFGLGATGFTGGNSVTPFGAFYDPATGGPITTPSGSTGLRGGNGITQNSVNSLLNAQGTNYNQFYIHAFAGGVYINALIEALSAKQSFDELAEPSALTKSGDQANLQAVRLFPYPVTFDPPEFVTPPATGGGGANNTNNLPAVPTVIATTPTEFHVAKVGVQLLIKPQVGPDNKSIDLSLIPDVVDFDGFINYGSPISVEDPANTVASLLSPNVLNQPVFETRRIQTKVVIRDGATIVLGGLLREDLQNINDKVPLLGDLPLIGRLFQSKAVQSIKRNLLIFVTANIYRNNGELLNPPNTIDAAGILSGKVTVTNTGQ